MRVPPRENSTCTAFEEYERVPETVPLDFSEDDIKWWHPSSQALLGRWERRRLS